MHVAGDFYNIMPADCLKLDFKQSVEMVKSMIGKHNFELAKQLKITSPYKQEINSFWLKQSKIIGINPRITETYWGIVKYAMTFPENAIHIMPLFESGDGSIYVQNSWRLNEDFYDKNLEELGFKSSREQLKFVINILHAMGKAVGFDALPHVDNFSEIVILNPDYFEWIKLNPEHTAEDSSKNRMRNSDEVKTLLIKNFNLPHNFFEQDEQSRKELLFPNNSNSFSKRMQIRKIIRENGFEPVPVAEHSPLRPVIFKKIIHSQTENWAEFEIPSKNNSAKIIGSITPYCWYETDDDGYIKKNAERKEVWDYFINHIYEFQKEYDFDFLRADMAHNQIAHAHTEKKDFNTHEFWGKLKDKINTNKPHFASLGEAFLSTYYIDAKHDMTNKKFDLVLGNLNFQYLDDCYISQIIKSVNERELFTICNTIYTNDGDLPEHRELFQSQDANILRYFMGLFFCMPSYMGIGFETRNLFPEHDYEFSNYYVKIQKENFRFGNNTDLFKNITIMRKLYEKYRDIINVNNFMFLKTNSERVLCWSYTGDNYNLLCVANFDNNLDEIKIDNIKISQSFLKYSNTGALNINIEDGQKTFVIKDILIGECALFEYKKPTNN